MNELSVQQLNALVQALVQIHSKEIGQKFLEDGLNLANEMLTQSSEGTVPVASEDSAES